MNFTYVDPPHEDLVNDIVFDYYGKRFATCSSDKHIKVWSLDEDKGTWSCDDIQRAHQDIIWRLSWAHPEFGQLLASCSEDNTIRIWEEQGLVAENGQSSRWVRKALLSNSKNPIKDVKFSHRGLGLTLASACADGYVRIYEARDVFDLSNWDLKIEFQVEDTSIAEAQPGKVRPSEHGLTCLSWNDCPFEPARIAVGGYSKRVIVYSVADSTLVQECELSEHHNAISDIAWAPAMGRSYHLIATASREPSFKIHKLIRKENGSLEYDPTQTETIASISKAMIWRVTWNATGTVLAASAEDGTISLWRKDFSGKWTNVQNIPTENKMSYFYLNP